MDQSTAGLQMLLVEIGMSVGLASLLFFSYLAIRALKTYFYQRKIKALRLGETYGDFLRGFAGQAISEPILRETYVVLSKQVAFLPDFPVHAQDSLTQVYGINSHRGTDLVELIDTIAVRCNLHPWLSASSFGPVKTVADLVALLEASEASNRIYCPSPRTMETCLITPARLEHAHLN